MAEIKTEIPTFSRWERFLYFFVYITYLVYGLYKLIAARNQVLTISKFQFSPGWRFLDRPRDDTNDELENFTQFIRRSWYWYVLHCGGSLAVRLGWLRRAGWLHATVAAFFLCSTFHAFSVAMVVALLLSYYSASQCHRKPAVWALSVLWILVINVIKYNHSIYETLGYEEYFMLVVLLSWTLLRCSSYALNRINDFKQCSAAQLASMYSLEYYVGYTLYFPTLIYGPLMGYKRYIVISNESQSTLQHGTALWLLCRQLLRLFFWWFVMQLSLHYLYIHYMEHDVAAVQLIGNSYSQYAVGYFMGQFFFMYYVVTYGLGIALARFDGLAPPQPPRCIGRIHFYSDMWKYFDEGLYEFLFTHIYAELCKRHSSLPVKLLATAATFSFIFVWHGCYAYVLIWSALNFVCLVAEKLFKWFLSTSWYTMTVSVPLGQCKSQRLYALLATQIFIPAAFANVYFISGSDVGHFLMRGAYCSGIANYLTLTFCSYCFFQCSEMIKNH